MEKKGLLEETEETSEDISLSPVVSTNEEKEVS